MDTGNLTPMSDFRLIYAAAFCDECWRATTATTDPYRIVVVAIFATICDEMR